MPQLVLSQSPGKMLTLEESCFSLLPAVHQLVNWQEWWGRSYFFWLDLSWVLPGWINSRGWPPIPCIDPESLVLLPEQSGDSPRMFGHWQEGPYRPLDSLPLPRLSRSPILHFSLPPSLPSSWRERGQRNYVILGVYKTQEKHVGMYVGARRDFSSCKCSYFFCRRASFPLVINLLNVCTLVIFFFFFFKKRERYFSTNIVPDQTPCLLTKMGAKCCSPFWTAFQILY